MSYAITWEAGASAQIEIFSPELDAAAAEHDYRLKFSPPMRKTIRPPMTPLQLGRGELGPIIADLNRLGEALNARRAPAAAGAADAAADAAAAAAVLTQAQQAGGNLYDLIIPPDVQMELAEEDLFLEIGVDEALLEYPWELLHDGTEFLCLKHSIGRFVNVTKAAIPNRNRLEMMSVKPLSVLVIGVGAPQPRVTAAGPVKYDPLPGVGQETKAVADAIMELGQDADVLSLNGAGATWQAVANALKANRYHIIHYSGHASFDSSTPFNSSLALHDRDMTTGHIRNFCKQPPVLFFVNGCESTVARGAGSEWKDRYDIFGLARAFLETGAYLLGSRWKVGDQGAAKFAQALYAELLQEKPIGRAIREARCAFRKANPNDFSWASYVYYGDPRLRFRKLAAPVGG
jgi:CHAT domain-containing protein